MFFLQYEAHDLEHTISSSLLCSQRNISGRLQKYGDVDSVGERGGRGGGIHRSGHTFVPDFPTLAYSARKLEQYSVFYL